MQYRSVKDNNTNDLDVILESIVAQANMENVRITQHAQQEMDEEDIRFDEVLGAISNGEILENYSEHLRGACCLVNGLTKDKRPLHIVCTTEQPILIIITVYSPKQPKWITPTQRRR